MNLFFDEESQKLIVEAKKEMYELRHPYVGSEHLLLAILNNKELEITKMLDKYDITYDSFKKELINVVGIGTKSNNWFLFTPLLRRIINNATYYSKDNSKVVTPYNLFISILQEGDGVANRILLGMNIDINLLYDKFLSTNFVDKKINTPLLEELGVNMNKCSLNGKYDPVIGRENQINQLIEILLRKNKNNPLLIGEAGVGKTAIVEELARLISTGNVPFKLKDKVIYNVSMSSLVAGTKYRGEFEEKIHNLIDEVINNKNIILFIDEIHTLMGAGGAEGAIDASNIVKPYLARGDIKVIGATTVDEYNKYISIDKALDRRFKKIYVEEADDEAIKNILLGIKSVYEDYHKVKISDEVLLSIIDISNNCIFSGRQPDKAIDLLDQVCSYALLHNNKLDSIFTNYEVKIKELENKKNDEIIKHNFKQALVYKNKEMKLRSEYNGKLFSSKSSEEIVVSIEDIYSVISNKYLIPTRFNINSIKKSLKNSIYGQDNIINEVVDSLIKYNFIDNHKPLIYLFSGKSGVGKTFLVDKIVKNIFPRQNYISINISDYNSLNLLDKFKSIFSTIKDNPFTILLFDNIDKSNAHLSKFLREALEKGYLVNDKNEKINITKCIIFMTSRSINCDIGFINATNNSYYNITHSYVFNDIKKNILIKYLRDKDYDKNSINSIINDSNYEVEGFKSIINKT